MGDYTIIKQLGSGVYGQTFLATLNGTYYTIKTPLNVDDSQDCIRREVLALEKLAGRKKDYNLQRLHECIRDDSGNITTMVSKHIPGQDLDHWKGFNLNELDRILTDILTGLTVMHSFDVVHRDIKPPNIIYDQNTATIIDFGNSSIGPSNKLRGSLKYISKELILLNRTGGTYSLSALKRGDIYSTGFTMYMLAHNWACPFDLVPGTAKYKHCDWTTYRKPTFHSSSRSEAGHSAEQFNDIIHRMLHQPTSAKEFLKEWAPHRLSSILKSK